MKKVLSVSLTVILGIAVFLFIITFSIGLPIYCRFFYYAQINPLNIPESTGYDFATIKTAYDQVLDYLTLPNRTFGAGVFKFTEEGASHFADCKILFDLNATVLIISTVIVVTLLILEKFNVIKLCRPFGCSVALISAFSIFVVAIILALFIAIDFESAFITFHHLFFPGKDNWTFHPDYDEIITALPQEFFASCAVLIGASIILISAGIIIFQLVKRRKRLDK
ncbi:MAG: TIGR01906 family membrane protein [Clostridia bacterium]|nr:TIGR01906 family membrane protein [Clostridia bacterium]